MDVFAGALLGHMVQSTFLLLFLFLGPRFPHHSKGQISVLRLGILDFPSGGPFPPIV